MPVFLKSLLFLYVYCYMAFCKRQNCVDGKKNIGCQELGGEKDE